MRHRAWPLIAQRILVLACAVTLVLRYVIAPVSVPGDFQVYLKATARVFAGETPYRANEFSPYKYSPGLLPAVAALPADPQWSWRIFASLSIAGVLVALASPLKSFMQLSLLALGLGVSWKGIIETLDYGQTELLLLGLATVAAHLRKRSPLVAGLLIGTLPWIKLPWAFVTLAFVERRALAGMAIAAVGWGIALPVLAFGPARAWTLYGEWRALLGAQPRDLWVNDINQGLYISLIRWTGDQPLVAASITCLIGGLIVGRLLARHPEPMGEPGDVHPNAWIAPWLVAGQLLNPLGWRWGSALAVALPLGARRGRWLEWGAVALLLVIQLNPAVRALGLQGWTQPHAFGTITLFWMALLGLVL